MTCCHMSRVECSYWFLRLANLLFADSGLLTIGLNKQDLAAVYSTSFLAAAHNEPAINLTRMDCDPHNLGPGCKPKRS